MADSDNLGSRSLILLYPHAETGNGFLGQLKSQLETDTSLQLHPAQSDRDIDSQLQNSGRGLLIFCIRNKEDLVLVLNAMSTLQNYIRGKALRVIGVSELNHPQVPAMLMKRGCADVFAPGLNVKALRHKINQSFKILATYNGRADPGAAVSLEAAPKKTSAPVQSQSGLKKLGHLVLASDCWLIRKERDLRRVQGRWIADLIGPGPSLGTWEPVLSPSSDEWEWKPKSLADGSITEKDFISDSGAWFYVGRKPEFVWDLGRWRFLGDRMDLSFRNGTELLGCRFKLASGLFEYAENSPQARLKLPVIVKSIEFELRFRQEGKKSLAGAQIGARPESADLMAQWEKEETPDAPELALVEAPEVNPYNQAPQPKLKIWIAPLEPKEGAAPLEANPVELSETTLVIEVVQGHFKSDDQVVIVMDDGLMQANSKSRLKAALKQVERGEETDTLTLETNPALLQALAPLQTAFEARQREIIDFMKAARGW